MREKIALIHPPKGEEAFQLDGYCSQPQKGPFRWHPLDLLTLASFYQSQADIFLRDWGLSSRGNCAIPAQATIIVGMIGVYGYSQQMAYWRDVAEQW